MSAGCHSEMPPVALITGARGFTGRYMVEELQRQGCRVVGLVHGEPRGENELSCDLLDRERLPELIAQVKPDYVVHLAAISFVAHDDVDTIYRVNLLGTLNLLSSLMLSGVCPRKVLLASSANVYGNAKVSLLDEGLCPAPENHYAVSKLAMEQAARQWYARLPIVVARPFNYSGVGQAPHFLLPKIVEHYRRGMSRIELGNLDVSRDFSDVRAVVSIYRELLESPVTGETFNICSGVGHTLTEVLEMMAEIAGYSIEVHVNPAFVRENEVKTLVGSNAKLRKAITVPPLIPLKSTLHWMFQAAALQPQ